MTDLTDEPFDIDWLQGQVDDISMIRSPLDRQLAAEGLVLSGELDDLIAEVRRHRQTIAAADQIHQVEVPDANWPACAECERSWPCPTRRALHPEERQ